MRRAHPPARVVIEQVSPEVDGGRFLLLRALLLDKAVYELRYELDNRPAWLRFPARGIRGLLEEHD